MATKHARVKRGLASLITITALTVGSHNAFADPPQMVEFPWVESLECAGDQIDLEGTARIILKQDYSGGRVNWMFQFRVHASGFSQNTGAEYTGMINASETFHDDSFSPPLPTNWVFRERGALIGRGAAPDYRYNYRFKFTVANGEIILNDETLTGGGCEYL